MFSVLDSPDVGRGVSGVSGTPPRSAMKYRNLFDSPRPMSRIERFVQEFETPMRFSC